MGLFPGVNPCVSCQRLLLRQGLAVVRKGAVPCLNRSSPVDTAGCARLVRDVFMSADKASCAAFVRVYGASRLIGRGLMACPHWCARAWSRGHVHGQCRSG